MENMKEQILQFITDLTTCAAATETEQEVIRSTFRAGYCWHFAHLLKTTFGRGQVCWAAPFGHFIWLDDDNTPYDVEGVYYGECIYFIPESYLGDALKDFTHIPGVAYNATAEQIMDIIHNYEDDNHIPHQDENVRHFLMFNTIS